jgi:uncharacterized membrane protein SpoIIM required for sporulation
MKQSLFETEHSLLWQRIESALKPGAKNRQDQADQLELPALYRRLCQSLALATQRGYSPQLCLHLHHLALQCHQQLYGTRVERPFVLHRWLMLDFPQRVRAEWRLLLLATLGFYGVALAVGLLIWQQPNWAYSFASPEKLHKFQEMYQSGSFKIGRGGDSGDLLMFGFYIWNNVSINFRTFAGGLLGGLPALLSIVYNGLELGVIGAWLSQHPDTRTNFWSFVVTHSSFEITGLLLAGVAGMRLGLSLLRPGRKSRRHALVDSSREMFPVLVGAALLTTLAAFFEAFWSGSTAIAPGVKFAVGALCWLSVILFFTLAGRGGHATR